MYHNIILIVLFPETGSLFMLAVKLMALFSTHQADYSKLADLIGIYFQIRDDYINLVSKDVRYEIIWSTIVL